MNARAPRPHLLHRARTAGVAGAVAWLNDNVTASTARAVELLKAVNARIELLGLYHQTFPEEFAASSMPLFPGDDEVREYRRTFNSEDLPHSARELEFFELIDVRLFPIPLYLRTGECGRLYHVPVCTCVPDWGEAEVEGFGPALGLAGALLTDGEWATPEDVLWAASGERAGLPDPRPRPIPSDTAWERVRSAFATDPGPAGEFVVALGMMNYTSGNAFVDHVCVEGECVSWYPWGRDTLDFLAAEYREALEIYGRVRLLDAWIGESPRERLSEIIDLWNTIGARPRGALNH